jgi:multiple sugar transport system permease protein
MLPLLWLLRVALTDKVTAYKIPPEWVKINFLNFIDIFVKYPFVSYFTNSIIIAALSTLITLPFAASMAYAFTRYNTGGISLRLLVLSTQLLPPVIIVLPLFSLYLKLSLLNSLTGIIIAHITISLPFLAWILVSFFEGNLIYLEQAARVDGASRFQAFFYIAIPVSVPGIIAAGVLAFILSWNEFILALILSGPQTNTIPVGLSSFQTHRGVDIAPLAAATICAITPVFLLLPFMKKYLISGLSLGALK